MIVILETEFGKVEINWGKGIVYFYSRDEIYQIDKTSGIFQDFNGTNFRIHWPYKAGNVTLTVERFASIGSVYVEDPSGGG